MHDRNGDTATFGAAYSFSIKRAHSCKNARNLGSFGRIGVSSTTQDTASRMGQARGRGALDVSAVTIASLLVFLPSFLWGLPHGDSYVLNVSWASEFIAALESGTLYPRWLLGLWEGAGGADFYFYPPFPFYLAAATHWLCGGCGVRQSLVISGLFFQILSGLGVLGLLRSLKAPGPALVGAVCFVLMPYHVVDWDIRQAYAEHAAFAIAPFVIWGLVRAAKCRRYAMLAAAVALLGLTHLPTLVVVVAVGLPVAIALQWPPSLNVMLRISLASALGLAVAAVYWLPAVSLLDTVNSALLQTGSWRSNMVDSVPYAPLHWQGVIRLLFIELSILSVVSLALSGNPSEVSKRLQITILATCWFFVTPLSAFLWQHTGLSIVQFPWRFFVAADIAFAMTMPALWAQAKRAGTVRACSRKWIGMFGTAAFALILLAHLSYWWWMGQREFLYPVAIEDRLGAAEWLGKAGMPSTVPLGGLDDPRLIRAKSPRATLQILKKTSRLVRFRADCPDGCRIVIRRTYWSLWELRDENTGAIVPISPSAGFPLISASLANGEHTYHLELRRPLAERVGSAVSMLAAFIALGVFGFGWLSRQRGKRA